MLLAAVMLLLVYIQENRQDIVSQVHNKLSCPSCGNVTLSNNSVECLSTGRTAVVSLTLLSQNTLATHCSIQLIVNGRITNGTFCNSDEKFHGKKVAKITIL